VNFDDASPAADAADAAAPADVEGAEVVEVEAAPAETPGDTPVEDVVFTEASEGPKEDEEDLDPVEEFRKALYAAPGDWYVV
jgi:transcriptional antiterminator NusG